MKAECTRSPLFGYLTIATRHFQNRERSRMCNGSIICTYHGICYDLGNSPCVVVASPGFLQSGVSRYLFERWCDDPKNGVILAGYTVEVCLWTGDTHVGLPYTYDGAVMSMNERHFSWEFAPSPL